MAVPTLASVTGGESGRRWRTDGRFFRAGGRRIRMNAVTYGPLPGGWPESFAKDFQRIAAAGFNAIRIYEVPCPRLLDEARHAGLAVFGGLKWAQSADFFQNPGLYSAARVQLAESLRETGRHPALAGIYVGNEVPADLVRWMCPLKVRRAIEELIALSREIAPHLLFAYANYPSTEYLEPENADFTAFNVYLESEAEFRSYVKRLHHIAGDRPLVISEFGLDSRRHGLDRQAETLRWANRAALDLETAGMTVYAWTDRWWNAGAEVLDWDFGLTNRAGLAKPALEVVPVPEPPLPPPGRISVIVCTRNGRSRIGGCLEALGRTGQAWETIVVDDGSTDATAAWISGKFPWVRILVLEPSGLSAARNAGAAAATGDVFAFTDDDCVPDEEWLARLSVAFREGDFAAAGGPNLPPPPRDWEEAVVSAAPGAPSHVMLTDEEAEHLPGCNLAVRREAFEEIGGFDERFHTAGDDVDFCWRLRDAGFRLGFAPGAFVWHWRRPSIRGFLRQQRGYGRAERLLLEKFPQHFTPAGETKWLGFIYAGGPVRVMADSLIYHGPMGGAGYQGIVNRMQPSRGLAARFFTLKSRLALDFVRFLQPLVRSWERNRRLGLPRWGVSPAAVAPAEEFSIHSATGRDRGHYLALLLNQGWQPCGETDLWDVEKNGVRVLLATERGDGIATRTLVRVAGGDPDNVVRLLAGDFPPVASVYDRRSR